jgi:hypothetical protein
LVFWLRDYHQAENSRTRRSSRRVHCRNCT